MKRLIVLCLSLAALSAPAYADRQAYCQAYARDFADQIAKDKAGWDHKFQIAMESCMGPKADTTPTAAPVPAPKAKAKAAATDEPAADTKPADAKPAKKAVADKPADTPVPPAQEGAAPTDKSADGEKLKPGSEAWNAYCAKKYTSFDPDTGKYKSLKGISRPCLVTKDFKG